MSSVNNINSRRIGGLASGMNTDEIVESMLANSQNKIDKELQNKQSLLWKQEAYRTVLRSVNSFTNKWFNVLDAKNNIGSASFWATAKATSSSNNFKVEASAGANAGSITVDYIKQLASSQTLNGKSNISGDIRMDLYNSSVLNDEQFTLFKQFANSMASAGETPYLEVSVDGVKKKIAYDPGEITDASTKEDVFQNMVSSLQSSLDTAFGAGKVKLQFDTDPTDPTVVTGMHVETSGSSKVTFSDPSGMLGTGFFGLQDGASNKLSTGTAISNLNLGASGGSYEFSINGVDFKFSSRDSLSTVMSKINSSDAGVKMSYSEFSDSFKLISTSEGAGDNIQIEQTSGDLLGALFGTQGGSALTSTGLNGPLKAGSSVNLNAIKKNISAAFEVTIDGVTKVISVPARDSTGNEIDYSKYEEDQIARLFDKEINDAFSTNKVTVNITNGKMSISHRDGAAISVGSYKGDSNMLSNLGFTNGQSNEVTTSTTLADLGITEDQSWMINGAEVNVSKTDTVQGLLDAINNNAGAKAKAELVNGRIKITSTDPNGDFSMEAKSGTDLMGLYSMFGTTGYTRSAGDQYLSTADKLSSLGVTGEQVLDINGTSIKVSASDTIETLMDKINNSGTGASVSITPAGEFSFTGANITTEKGNLLEKLFGASNGEITAGTVVSMQVSRNVAGQNAILSINGEEIERSSNTVTVDGVSITATNTFEGGSGEKISITTDTDEIVKKVKEFMEDYNKMIDEMQKLTTEKVYSDYKPLTDKQKEDMTEKQIELWETKAKSGILKGDQNISRLLQGMRSNMYAKTSSGLAMFDIGITTGDYSDGGKLKFADNLKGGKTGEDVLKEMLTKNPDQIRQMFTDTEGMANRMKNIMNDAASTSLTKKGYIANIAGLEGTFSDSENLLTKKITTIDETVKKYQKAMKVEEERYWKKFTALEKLVSQMNSQSSWLTQQFGG